MEGLQENHFREKKLIYHKHFLASAHSKYAQKLPQPPQFWLNLKNVCVKNIHFSTGIDNLERNPKSAPKKISRLCTFN